jgi:adenylate cyclase
VSSVLLIDDSKFLRRMTELAVARCGYDVLSAADGEEGLRLARDQAPSVIVLDMLLPKISGLELLQALKQDPRTAKIPVIVMSSLPQCNEARLKQTGAAAYLEKANLGVEQGAANLIKVIQAVLSPSGTAS